MVNAISMKFIGDCLEGRDCLVFVGVVGDWH